MDVKLAILGTGNIGVAIARGLARAELYRPDEIILTRRHPGVLHDLAAEGFRVQQDNADAAKRADILLLAVQPQQLDALLEDVGPVVDAQRHLVLSVVSGATIADIHWQVGKDVPVVRAMPNVAIAVRKSMTCLAATGGAASEPALATARAVFETVGVTRVIDEDQMTSATALCACGVAFFLRAVRAASQGGIEIGFHPEEALAMAAQTAVGAASLMLEMGRHPEHDIDTVTTPRGCTISGLNELEHRGFSSAMIKGILTAARKADSLYAHAEV
jgi:pyrroline-5-carboxylate reductase